ncbi:MAG: hypothetical protein HW416_2730 [Chloroflexi bacterium]|nr:hypothetical protein [Chloroflexota bacterium]
MIERSQVLVVGAGYAGLNAILRFADRREAEHKPRDLALIDRNLYHLVKIRLHEAAARDTDVTSSLNELLEDHALAFHQTTVTGLDFAERRVTTTGGPYHYDYLLLALGSVTNFFNIPGLEENSFALESLAQAVRLRGHIEEQVVEAAGSSDPPERERRLRFVIGGAGYTGIELAGEMVEMLARLCARVGLDRDAGQIIVVDAQPRVLPMLDEESSAYAAGELEKMGVQFRLGVKVASCSHEGVTLDPGGFVPTASMIWAGGIRANLLMASAGVEMNKQGRLIVDPMLRVPGYPEVFAVGDCAVALDPKTNQPIPATAQLALQEGELAAENILRALEGQEPIRFDPRSRGEVVSLGHDRAVGWAKLLGDRQIKLRGLIGGLAKRAGQAEWTMHLWRETHHLDDIYR